MKKIFYLLFSTTLLVSCNISNNNTNQVINIDLTNQEENFVKIDYYNLKVVQLEMNKSSILSSVFKAHYDKTNDRIFILSNFNLYIFDEDGNYINSLSKGRGPGEITFLASFTVDSNNKRVFVLDNGRFIKEYDYEGNHQSTRELDTFLSMDLHKEDSCFLLLNSFVGVSEKSFVGKYDITSDSITDKYVSIEDSDYPQSPRFITSNNFYKSNNEIYFFTPGIFALYKYDNSYFKMLYKFDIGKKRVPNSLIDNTFKDNANNFLDLAIKANYVPCINFITEFNDYIFVGLHNNLNDVYAFNKNSPEKTLYAKDISSFFDIPKVDRINRSISNQSDMMIFTYTPIDFFDENDIFQQKTVQIANEVIEIKEDANPILVIIE